jgi:hypothetical protein
MSRNCSWLNAVKKLPFASWSTRFGVRKPRSEKKRLRRRRVRAVAVRPAVRQDRGLARKLGVPAAHPLEVRLHVGDDLARLRLGAQRAADEHGLVLPRHAEVDEVARLRDGRRDARQALVGVLLETGVDRDDQVRAPRGDRLEVDLLPGDHRRLRAAERLLRPGPLPPFVAAEEVADADRHDAEREHRVLVGVADGHDALGLALDPGGAELVLDRDRERAALRLRAGRPVAGRVAVVAAAAAGKRQAEHQRRERGRRTGHEMHRFLLGWEIGRHSGVPVTGSSTTDASRPNTSWTKAPSTTSPGGPAACTLASRIATRWSA